MADTIGNIVASNKFMSEIVDGVTVVVIKLEF